MAKVKKLRKKIKEKKAVKRGERRLRENTLNIAEKRMAIIHKKPEGSNKAPYGR